MTWTPPVFAPGVIWQDRPSTGTPLDATNLNLEENSEAAYAATVGTSLAAYADTRYVQQGIPLVIAPAPSGGDDLAVLQALLTPGMRLLLRSNSIYLFSGPLLIPNYAQVEGCGVQTICRAQGNNYVFSFAPGNQTRISNLQIDATSIQVSGGAIDWTNAANNTTIDNIQFGNNLFISLNVAPVASSGIHMIDRIRWNGVVNCGTGIIVGDGTHLCSDIVVSRAWGTASTNADMGQWFNVVPNTDTFHLLNSLFIKGTTGSKWQGGTNHKATNLTIDGGQPGLQINNTLDLELDNVTVSNPTNGGIQVSSGAVATKIRGGIVQRGQTDGVDLFLGSTYTTIIGLTCQDNNQSNTGTSPAISVAASVTRFTVADCTLGNFSAQAGSTTHGVLVAAGPSDFYTVVNNQCPGNKTASVLDNGTGAHKTLTGNIS